MKINLKKCLTDIKIMQQEMSKYDNTKIGEKIND